MKDENKVGSRQAVRGIVVTIFWTLGSRVLGLIRDVCMTAALGATAGHGNFLMAWIGPRDISDKPRLSMFSSLASVLSQNRGAACFSILQK